MGERMKTALLLMSGLLLVSCAPRRANDPAESQPLHENGAAGASVEPEWKAVMGQTIYVPIYSHIYISDKSRSLNLAATLSIRNTDAHNPIRISSAKYFNSNGGLIRDYAARPLTVAPMASAEIVIAEKDTFGGSGASFVVEWSSGFRVMDPVVEAVMIGAAGQQGISFVSIGRVIKNQALP
jgi:hypothetical protein